MWTFFVRHQKFTYIVAIAIVLVGLLSILQIPKESNPEIDIPVAVVTTPFPGANAVDVEEFVTNPIEDALLGIADIDTLTSSSRLGASSVVLEFEIGTDMQEKLTDIREAVDRARAELPTDAEDSIVARVSFDDTPIKVFAIGGPYGLEAITDYANTLEADLERVPGVASVDVIGGLDPEIRVLVRREALDQYGLSIRAVTGAISQANSNVPIGSIETESGVISLRFEGQLRRAEDLARVPVGARGGVPVYVADIATIIDGYADQTTLSALSLGEGRADAAVSLRIRKSSDGNILDIVQSSDAVIERAQETYLPADLVIKVVDDDAQFVIDDLRNLSLSGLQTTLIVVFLILLFLGWREALLAGIAIPMSFFITFAALQFLGFTLNFLTLFSLILALGILVDGAIVMTEGIYEHMKQGKTSRQAAMDAVEEFKAPLIAGMLTTIFAFMPMLLSSGLIGEFIKSIPVTVSLVLVASLFVALALIPTFAAVWLKERTVAPTGRLRVWFQQTVMESSAARALARLRDRRDRLYDAFRDRYTHSLEGFLQHKSQRRWLTWSLVAGFIFAIALPVAGILNVDMFPATDLDRLYVSVELPYGTPLEETEQVMRSMESELIVDDRIESYLLSTGTDAFLGGSGSHVASATLNLVDRKERIDSRDMITELEATLATYVDRGTVLVNQLGTGPDAAAPVEIKITGPELETLELLASDMEAVLEAIPGTRSIQSSVEETAGEFVLSIDRSRAAALGLSPTDIALVLRTAVFGSTATTINTETDDVDVVVKYQFQGGTERVNRTTVDDVLATTIQTASGPVPLSAVLTSGLAQSRAAVQHEDGERIVRVTSQVQKGVLAQEIFLAVESELSEMAIPAGYEVQMGGQDESTQESFTDLYKAMVIGIFLIGALLVLQFNSFRQPFFIIASIPLALIGVLPGLALIGQPLSFPGMIGVVALAGIVVNNGIILVDRLNENRRNGMAMHASVIDAAGQRFRPILLTTLTTISGMLPLVISQPSWGPLGFAIIFGLLFSTVLTLYVVPLLYNRYAEPVIE